MAPLLTSLECLSVVLAYLGVTVAPTFCSCARALVPPEALGRLHDDIAALHDILRIQTVVPPPPSSGTQIASLVYFLRLSSMLIRLVTEPFQRLDPVQTRFPGFNEAADFGVLLLPSSAQSAPLETFVRTEANISQNEEPFDLLDCLSTILALPLDFLDAWELMNTDAALGAVRPAAALLRVGSYEVSFFPTDLVASRDTLLMISFSVCGVLGVYVVEEAFVDPVGFHFS